MRSPHVLYRAARRSVEVEEPAADRMSPEACIRCGPFFALVQLDVAKPQTPHPPVARFFAALAGLTGGRCTLRRWTRPPAATTTPLTVRARCLAHGGFWPACLAPVHAGARTHMHPARCSLEAARSGIHAQLRRRRRASQHGSRGHECQPSRGRRRPRPHGERCPRLQCDAAHAAPLGTPHDHASAEAPARL